MTDRPEWDGHPRMAGGHASSRASEAAWRNNQPADCYDREDFRLKFSGPGRNRA